MSPEDVIREVSPIYLPELPHRIQTRRSRRIAALLAFHSISDAIIKSRGAKAENLVKKQRGIKGRSHEHFFDVVVENGRPYLAAQGLSFETLFSGAIQKDVDATAWAIDDIRKTHHAMPVAVLALMSSGQSVPFERAKKIFRSLKADLVPEGQFDGWTKKAIKSLPSVPSTLI